MKKLALSAILVGFSSLYAFDTNIYVGASASKVGDRHYSSVGVGYSATTGFGNGFLFGFGNSFNYGKIDDRGVYTLDADAKIGYQFMPELRAYLIGTGVIQKYRSDEYAGFGYGVSAEYRLSSNTVLEGSYKTTRMHRSGGNSYDYDTYNLAIKFAY